MGDIARGDVRPAMTYDLLRNLLIHHPVMIDLHCFYVTDVPHDAIQRVGLANYSSYEDKPASHAFKYESDFLVLSLLHPDNRNFVSRDGKQHFITVAPGVTTLREVLEFLAPSVELADATFDESIQAVFPSIFPSAQMAPSTSLSLSASSGEFSRAQSPQVVRIVVNAMPTKVKQVKVVTNVYNPHSSELKTFNVTHINMWATNRDPKRELKSRMFYRSLESYDFKQNQYEGWSINRRKASFFTEPGNYQYELQAGWKKNVVDISSPDIEPYLLTDWTNPTLLEILTHFAQRVSTKTEYYPKENNPIQFETSLLLILFATPVVLEPSFTSIMSRGVDVRKRSLPLVKITPRQFGSFTRPFVVRVRLVDRNYDYIDQHSIIIHDPRMLHEVVPPHTQPITVYDLFTQMGTPQLQSLASDNYTVVAPPSFFEGGSHYGLPIKLYDLEAKLIDVLNMYKIEASEILPKSSFPEAPEAIYDIYLMEKQQGGISVMVSIAPHNVDARDVDNMATREFQITDDAMDIEESLLDSIPRNFWHSQRGKGIKFTKPLPENFEGASGYRYSFIHAGRLHGAGGFLSPNDPTTLLELLESDAAREYAYEQDKVTVSPISLDVARVTYYNLIIFPLYY